MVVIIILSHSACRQTQTPTAWRLVSPDGKVIVNLRLNNADGRLLYEVSLLQGSDVVQVMKPSPLGVEAGGVSFDAGLAFVSADTSVIDERYTLASGKQRVNRAWAKTIMLAFNTPEKNQVHVEFRAYPEGVTFRYVFPQQQIDTLTVVKELTGFRLPDEGRCWLQPYDTVSQYTPGYEKYFYENTIGAPSPNPAGWCFPALFQTPGAWVLLTESNVAGGYFGSHLQNHAQQALYTIQQPDATEVYGQGSVNATLALPAATPWRVIMVGESVAQIVESNLVSHVADPPAGDFSWVMPGRASWSWWSNTASPRDYPALKAFVDLAADMQWEYTLVDANWNEMEHGDVPALVKYAAQKNVGVWLWYNSGGTHNTVTEQPRDIMNDPVRRKAEMQKLETWGVKGIKVDFFQSDKPFIMQEYLDILKDAAAHHIHVNFHGCTIPRGWSRTWPNLLSMESVMGAESYLYLSGFPEMAPLHHVHLAFTRNVIGPMDYTPVTFTRMKLARQTTVAHELALSVVFESGIVHLADAAPMYRTLPPAPKQFLQRLPVAWDSTLFLSGTPSTHVVVARKKDKAWYVACINGERKPQAIALNLSFLAPGAYEITTIRDGATPEDFATEKIRTDNTRTHEINVLSHGGWVAAIVPVP